MVVLIEQNEGISLVENSHGQFPLVSLKFVVIDAKPKGFLVQVVSLVDIKDGQIAEDQTKLGAHQVTSIYNNAIWLPLDYTIKEFVVINFRIKQISNCLQQSVLFLEL